MAHVHESYDGAIQPCIGFWELRNGVCRVAAAPLKGGILYIYIYIYISEWGGFPWTGYLIPVRGACWWLLGVMVVGASSSSPSASFLDSSGWHSDQGSQNPGIAWEFRLWKNTSGKRARLFAENFDARLAGIVIWSDCPLFEKKSSGGSNWQNMTKLTIYMLKKSGGVIFLRSPKRRRQRPPDAQGWGSQSGVKTVSKEDFE